VLAEGMALPEASANLATRILVAGMKEPLPGTANAFLNFRIVLAAVPVADMAPKAVLQKLSSRMDDQAAEKSERRITTLTSDELLA